jgi:hypothetical protein
LYFIIKIKSFVIIKINQIKTKQREKIAVQSGANFVTTGPVCIKLLKLRFSYFLLRYELINN